MHLGGVGTVSIATEATAWAGKGTARRHAVDMFIIHHAATTSLAAVRAMFGGRAYEVSANYIVKDGQIVAAVPESMRAWTSGSASDGGKGADFDHRAITVETCNSATGEPWPISEASYRSLARMAADFHRRYGVPLDRDHIVGHGELWTRWRASYATRCPGGIDLDRIVRDARAIINGTQEDDPMAALTDKQQARLLAAAEEASAAARWIKRRVGGSVYTAPTLDARLAAIQGKPAATVEITADDLDEIAAAIRADLAPALVDELVDRLQGAS